MRPRTEKRRRSSVSATATRSSTRSWAVRTVTPAAGFEERHPEEAKPKRGSGPVDG